MYCGGGVCLEEEADMQTGDLHFTQGVHRDQSSSHNHHGSGPGPRGFGYELVGVLTPAPISQKRPQRHRRENDKDYGGRTSLGTQILSKSRAQPLNSSSCKFMNLEMPGTAE